jgi:two-component system sensor histidine kinase YesM
MDTPVAPTPGLLFPIKWKLIVYSLIFMALMGFTGIYVNLGLKMSARFFKGILDEYKYLEVLAERVYRVKFYTENFLAEDSYANLEKCLAAQADLRDGTQGISNYLYLADNEAKYYSYLDLAKCLENYADLSEKAVSTRRAGTLEIAYAYNYKMAASAELISKYLAGLVNRNANWGNERFVRLTRQTKRIEHLTYALAGVIALLSITYCFIFAVGITKPLKQMVKNAEKIGEGHFRVREVAADSADELQIIAGVFNRMSRNIHDLFCEIQKKVQLETELKEEKMRNLEIENMLRETEFQVLQSQVNPHFLYNTLNAISQVAILEDAGETGELIKAVARFLRYNLQSLDQPVTLGAEIAHLKEYIYIMKVRYGERIKCEIDCPAGLDRYLIPCMTLQPILENAYIHGVAPLSGREGKISIHMTESDEHLQITIADNGVGVAPGKLLSLLKEKPKGVRSRRSPDRSSGLGLANVRKRLELFYHRDNLLTVSGRPGEGTRIVLVLPILEEVEVSVQSDDC